MLERADKCERDGERANAARVRVDHGHAGARMRPEAGVGNSARPNQERIVPRERLRDTLTYLRQLKIQINNYLMRFLLCLYMFQILPWRTRSR